MSTLSGAEACDIILQFSKSRNIDILDVDSDAVVRIT